jgi:hypothetical protein
MTKWTLTVPLLCAVSVIMLVVQPWQAAGVQNNGSEDRTMLAAKAQGSALSSAIDHMIMRLQNLSRQGEPEAEGLIQQGLMSADGADVDAKALERAVLTDSASESVRQKSTSLASQKNSFATAQAKQDEEARYQGKEWGGAFLQAAYRNAQSDNPQLAQRIKTELQLLQQENTANEFNNSAGGGFEKTPQASANAAAAGQQNSAGSSKADEQLNSDDTKENVADTKDNQDAKDDYGWCGSRPEFEAGKFRCPCPSDKSFHPNWRQAYNPDFLVAQGCV